MIVGHALKSNAYAAWESHNGLSFEDGGVAVLPQPVKIKGENATVTENEGDKTHDWTAGVPPAMSAKREQNSLHEAGPALNRFEALQRKRLLVLCS